MKKVTNVILRHRTKGYICLCGGNMKVSNKTINLSVIIPNLSLSNTLNERVKLIISLYNLNKKDICKALVISRNTLYKKEIGEINFTDKDIERLIKHFNIDKQLLDLSINSWFIDFV